MVQVTFDTNTDSLDELQEALRILQTAIARRVPQTKMDIASVDDVQESKVQRSTQQPVSQDSEEETAVDTPFFKITVKSDEHKNAHVAPNASATASTAAKAPTLNQLLHDESLTEDELARMFGQEGTHATAHKASATASDTQDDVVEVKNDKNEAYIEIIDYSEEKK